MQKTTRLAERSSTGKVMVRVPAGLVPRSTSDWRSDHSISLLTANVNHIILWSSSLRSLSVRTTSAWTSAKSRPFLFLLQVFTSLDRAAWRSGVQRGMVKGLGTLLELLFSENDMPSASPCVLPPTIEISGRSRFPTHFHIK